MDYAIALLSYNHETLTALCLKSILDKKFPSDKIYLIHNGTNFIKYEQLKNQFPNIRHILIETNKGYSGGANHGLLEIFKEHQQVLFLTNDTEILELPWQFPKNKNFFAVPIYIRNTNKLHSTLGELNIAKGHLMHLSFEPAFLDFQPSKLRYIPGTAFGITKKLFVSLNGFDEAFHTYWEDVDLSYRATMAGFKLDYDSSFKIKHKIGKTCHKDRFYTLFLYQRNRRWFLQKHKLITLKFYVTYFYDLTRLFLKLLKKSITDLKKSSDFNYFWRILYEKYKHH